jgi:hypothetical protein
MKTPNHNPHRLPEQLLKLLSPETIRKLNERESLVLDTQDRKEILQEIMDYLENS